MHVQRQRCEGESAKLARSKGNQALHRAALKGLLTSKDNTFARHKQAVQHYSLHCVQLQQGNMQ
jgi:hypothetical protein